MPILQFVPTSGAMRIASPLQDPLLFSYYDLDATLQAQSQTLKKEIDEYDAASLANSDPEEFYGYLESKYLVDLPELRVDSITVSEGPPVDIPVSDTSSYRRETTLVEGQAYSFHIPIVGQPELLECAHNVKYMYPGHPRGYITATDLVLTHRGIDLVPVQLRPLFDRDLAEINKRLENVRKQLSEWNGETKRLIRSRIGARLQRLQAITTAFGFPLRQRPAPPPQYGSIGIRRRLPMPTAHEGPYLEMQHYEQILTTVRLASQIFERSPSAFANLKEEIIRHHLLVALNAVYEGQANAETFNFTGKTDILIRHQGRAIFIAECKFWKGRRSLIKAIDQLLGYTTWRDTKLALFVFNRGGELSRVLTEIRTTVREHASFVREEAYVSSTGHRVILRHRDDGARELLLTIDVFELPRIQSES
jgi:hypothetical protein